MANDIMESLKIYNSASQQGFYGTPWFQFIENYTTRTSNLVKHRDRMFKEIGSVVDQSLQGSFINWSDSKKISHKIFALIRNLFDLEVFKLGFV